MRAGHSVSSSSAVSSPSPANDGLPGNAPTTISSGENVLLVCERERVDQLQLIVEIVLEPEHHLLAVA
jgi:hypothetical protein